MAALQAQSDLDVFRVDTTGGKTLCLLPAIYFTPGTEVINPQFRGDLYLIAEALDRFPDLKIRLHPDGYYKRFDRKQHRLNRRRIHALAKELHFIYNVAPRRLIKEWYTPWDYRRKKDPPQFPLAELRVVCDCVWKHEPKVRKPEDSTLPAPEEVRYLDPATLTTQRN